MGAYRFCFARNELWQIQDDKHYVGVQVPHRFDNFELWENFWALDHSSPLESFGPQNITFNCSVGEGTVPSPFQSRSIWLWKDLFLWSLYKGNPHSLVLKTLFFYQEWCLSIVHQCIHERNLQWMEFEHCLLDIQSKEAHTTLNFPH